MALAALLALYFGAIATGQQAAAATTDWRVRATFISAGGNDVPLRWGRADTTTQVGFGWNHMVSRGNYPEYGYPGAVEDIEYVLDACSKPVEQATAGTWRCERTMYGNPDAKHIVIFGARVDDASGDGRPVGVITAYLDYKPCGCGPGFPPPPASPAS